MHISKCRHYFTNKATEYKKAGASPCLYSYHFHGNVPLQAYIKKRGPFFLNELRENTSLGRIAVRLCSCVPQRYITLQLLWIARRLTER